jgi:hypothetical protein
MIEKKHLPILIFIIFMIVFVNLLLNYKHFIGKFERPYWLDLSLFENPLKEPKLPKGSKIPSCDTSKFQNQKIPNRAPFHWTGKGLMTIWFDDAYASEYDSAFLIMSQYQFLGAISIPVNSICYHPYMTWEQIKNLQSQGWEITSHGLSHDCRKFLFNDSTIQSELTESKQILEQHGFYVEQFVLPCDYAQTIFFMNNDQLKQAVKQVYGSMRTVEKKRINPLPVKDPYNLKAMQVLHNTRLNEIETAIEMTKRNKGWLILVFHNINNDNDPLSISEQRFTQILDLIKQSELSVVLPSQALSINNHTYKGHKAGNLVSRSAL